MMKVPYVIVISIRDQSMLCVNENPAESGLFCEGPMKNGFGEGSAGESKNDKRAALVIERISGVRAIWSLGYHHRG